MFSSGVEGGAAKHAALSAGHAGSIAGRLTLLYSLSFFGLLFLATLVLHHSLAGQLEQEDRDSIAEKFGAVRGVLLKQPGNSRTLAEEVRRVGGERRGARYFIRVLDERRETVLETPGMKDSLPARSFPAPTREPEDTSGGVPWKTPRASYLLASEWVPGTASGATPHLVQVALDVSPEDELLARYRYTMAGILLAGVLLSAGICRLLSREALRPLEAVAAAAERITAVDLQGRLGHTPWPSELTRLAEAFDAMLDRIEAAFERLSRFSSDLAHELRTPLNNLKGEAEVALSRARSPEELRQVLESGLEEYGRLTRLIDSILFLSRPKQHLERAPLDVREEVDALLEFYDAAAEERGVALSCSGNAHVLADATLFRRAVENVLSNALRYTPPGGSIAIVARQDPGGAVVEVADTGVGIDEGDLPRVFQRFFRGQRARALEPQGAGLGLALVQSILEAHGGTVTVRSEPGRGTVVTLSFPTTPAAS